MAEIGHNPARIIPVWRQFLDDHAAGGQRVRGIGEPIWSGRSPAELVECQRHESLLNVAFQGAPAWWLLCPYDAETLDRPVIEEAHRSHPWILQAGVRRKSCSYRAQCMPGSHLADPLPQPARVLDEMSFGPRRLSALRRMSATYAHRFGLDRARTDDLVLAVNEVATNSLCHGGGRGTLRLWRDGKALVFEVHDRGRIDETLAGRERPPTDGDGGRGLWLVNQLCDLVQIRAFPTGSVVRLHLALDHN
jgi:anti-sigma regulatory factor (Ser/Thr protein kinase)